MKSKCLTEENLIELFYEPETANAEYKAHMKTCEKCQSLFSNLFNELSEISIDTPDCSDAVVDEIERIIVEKQKTTTSESDVITVEEVAEYLQVSVLNVMNMLHDIPHFVFDDEIRFRRIAVIEYIEKLEGRSRSDAHRSNLRLIKSEAS